MVATERLFGELMEAGDRYRFLVAEPSTVSAETARALSDERLDPPLLALMTRGQASGELSNALSPEWKVSVFGTILVAALRDLDARRLDRARAVQLAVGTVVSGLRAPG